MKKKQPMGCFSATEIPPIRKMSLAIPRIGKLLEQLALNKSVCVRYDKDPGILSGYAIKSQVDISDTIGTFCLQTARKRGNILPIFIRYRETRLPERPLLPYSAIFKEFFGMSGLYEGMEYIESKSVSVLLCVAGLSSVYQNESAKQIWAQLQTILIKRRHMVILMDSHPDFLRLIESDTNWMYVREKYGVIRPDFDKRMIQHVVLEEM